MQTNQYMSVNVQIIHNDKPYLLILPYGVPFQEAIDAFNEMGKEINKMVETAKKAEEEQKKSTEEITPEVVS